MTSRRLPGTLCAAVLAIGCSASQLSTPCNDDGLRDCTCPGGERGALVCSGAGTSAEECTCDAGLHGSSGTDGLNGGHHNDGAANGGAGSTTNGTMTSGGDSGASTGSPVIPVKDCRALPLTTKVVDAEYSESLNKIVAVDAINKTIALIDPDDGSEHVLQLSSAPIAVSVAPDGNTAVVAHDFQLSVIDLQVPALVQTFPTTCDAFDVVLGGNRVAHIFPATDDFRDVRSVDIDSGVEHTVAHSPPILESTVVRAHPKGEHIYGVAWRIPADIQRYKINASGLDAEVVDSPYHGDYAICRGLWTSRDGTRLFNACGTVFQLRPGEADDMFYEGRLDFVPAWTSAAAPFKGMVHDDARGLLYAIPPMNPNAPDIVDPTDPGDTELAIYAYDGLQHQKSVEIPCLRRGSANVPLHGQFVFIRREESAVYVFGQVTFLSVANEYDSWAITKIEVD